MSGLPGPDPADRPDPAGRRTDRGVRVDPDAAAEAPERRATLSVLVDHEPGVLSAVAGLFTRRQFNIESLSVGPTRDPELARITLVCAEPDAGVDQLAKQLAKLQSVHAVTDLDDPTERELALATVAAPDPDDVRAVAEMVDARPVDVGRETVTLEVTGPRHAVDDALAALERFEVREVVRTGVAALASSDEQPTPVDDEAPTTEDHTTDATAEDPT
jgi:acetolactate synthase-1/3 small subunit